MNQKDRQALLQDAMKELGVDATTLDRVARQQDVLRSKNTDSKTKQSVARLSHDLVRKGVGKWNA
ncbi:MAG: hypothetical protein O3A01_02960 [bacterium]|nr:hypothetical protein [bacterium]